MKIGYFALTEQGFQLLKKLNEKLPGQIFTGNDFKENIERAWTEVDACVCVMAAGIVIRHLAPLFSDKDKDPAVIVMDTKGQWAVSLLAGHLGGANALARKLAEISGGQPVITTATDVEGVIAFDEAAKKNHLLIQNLGTLKYVSSSLLRGDEVKVVIDPLYTIKERGDRSLYLRPQTLILGVGCKKGMDWMRMKEAFLKFAEEYLPVKKVLRAVATIDVKAGERAVLELAEYLDVPLMVISRKMVSALNFEEVPGGPIEASHFVEKTIGVGSVAEASAYLAARAMVRGKYETGRGWETEPEARIRINKRKYDGITFSLAEMMQKIEL